MKNMPWIISGLLIISTPVWAQESFRPAPIQPNAAPVLKSGTTTYLAPENNTGFIYIPENTSVNQGAYGAVPLEAPLTPIGGGISADNGGMNSNGSRSVGIGR